MRFEWDSRKAASNLKKHGVSFKEAATAFGDPESLVIPDPDHSKGEDRQIIIGMSGLGKLVVSVFTDSDDTIRIISARRATKREQREYAE